jgi:hypothetical protein
MGVHFSHGHVSQVTTNPQILLLLAMNDYVIYFCFQDLELIKSSTIDVCLFFLSVFEIWNIATITCILLVH